jgi:glycosyltransferase involved in cell wall biosynthesis
MRQTYEGDIECIVVDDCGTDGSMGIVNKLILEYNGPIMFKILHHTHNRGLSAARNTGISNASGDYLLFLDSDDSFQGARGDS